MAPGSAGTVEGSSGHTNNGNGSNKSKRKTQTAHAKTRSTTFHDENSYNNNNVNNNNTNNTNNNNNVGFIGTGLIIHKGASVDIQGNDGKLYKGRDGGAVIFSPTTNDSRNNPNFTANISHSPIPTETGDNPGIAIQSLQQHAPSSTLSSSSSFPSNILASATASNTSSFPTTATSTATSTAAVGSNAFPHMSKTASHSKLQSTYLINSNIATASLMAAGITASTSSYSHTHGHVHLNSLNHLNNSNHSGDTPTAMSTSASTSSLTGLNGPSIVTPSLPPHSGSANVTFGVVAGTASSSPPLSMAALANKHASHGSSVQNRVSTAGIISGNKIKQSERGGTGTGTGTRGERNTRSSHSGSGHGSSSNNTNSNNHSEMVVHGAGGSGGGGGVHYFVPPTTAFHGSRPPFVPPKTAAGGII
jgi:hypothetical protein